MGEATMIRIVCIPIKYSFCFRNAHFSRSVWPRLWSAGSQGTVEKTWPDDVGVGADDEVDYKLNVQVRGTTKYHLSPHEQKAFAGVISTGVPNTLWRIR